MIVTQGSGNRKGIAKRERFGRCIRGQRRKRERRITPGL